MCKSVIGNVVCKVIWEEIIIKEIFILKIKNIFGTFIMSAVLLTSVSPLANAEEVSQTKNYNQNTETQKENKALDELFKNPEYVNQKTTENLPKNLKEGTSERIGGSFAVKKGIKAMISNKKTVFFWCEGVKP